MADSKIRVATHGEYLNERLQLLQKEKDLMKHKDEVTKQRQALPIVEVQKQYTFRGIDSSGHTVDYTLSELFFDRPQLIVYHAMFDPSWENACPSCSVLMTSMAELKHLNSRGVSLVAISRAPLEKIEKYKQRLGFSHIWLSSEGSDFNYDFQVTVDESKGQGYYNFRTKAENEKRLMPWFTRGEQPGHSVFIRGDMAAGIGLDGKIYHTYSSYARAGESVIPTFAWLDMTLLGRRDDMTSVGGLGFKRVDEYNKDELKGCWDKKSFN